MSYFNAARKAGTCKPGVCEEDDYIYDAPHLSASVACPVQGTSYCEIAQKVHLRKSDDAGVNHITPDVWENLWLSVSEAA
jgi:hypothetical protein